MNLVFVTEARFFKNNNGEIYGDAAFEHQIWERYLNVFEKLFIVARVAQKIENDDPIYISSGPNVHFIEIPYYVGPLQYLFKSFQIHAKIKELVTTHIDNAFICRIPGNMGDMVIRELKKHSKKYGVEVVGDPDDVFSDKSFNHPLKKFFHSKTIRNLNRNVAGADAVLYVTKTTLQKKYPPPPNAFSTYASNVMLATDVSARTPRNLKTNKTFKILCAGSLEQMYKAPDVALEAVKLYNEKFPHRQISFTWLGGGTYLETLKKQCDELKLPNFHFNGQVSLDQVDKEMRESDLFVLISRTEGLPRVIIEAMAHGLPVIGTKVGGIPELLSEEVLIKKNDAAALAHKIYDLLSQPEFYTRISTRNLMEAKEYETAVLRSRREEFYQTLKTRN